MIKFTNIINHDVVEVDEVVDEDIIDVLRKHSDWRELMNL